MQTVIIVAKDYRTLEAHRELLESEGFNVLACIDGETAFRVIAIQRVIPDALIVDYKLPGMTGVQLLASLKDALKRTFPTLLVGDMPAVTGFLLGVRGFLNTPIDGRQLIRRLRDLLHEPEVFRHEVSVFDIMA